MSLLMRPATLLLLVSSSLSVVQGEEPLLIYPIIAKYGGICRRR